jgi:hypothetical protein
MVKISQQKEYLPLAMNADLIRQIQIASGKFENIKTEFSGEYDCDNSYISFAKICESLELFKSDNYITILALSTLAYGDLLTDRAALRMYDSSLLPAEVEFVLHYANKKLYVVPNESLSKTAIMFSVIGTDLLEETMSFEIDSVKIDYRKDLANIPVNVNTAFLLKNIRT